MATKDDRYCPAFARNPEPCPLTPKECGARHVHHAAEDDEPTDGGADHGEACPVCPPDDEGHPSCPPGSVPGYDPDVLGLCPDCIAKIGGACAGPDAEYRPTVAGEPCGAADHSRYVVGKELRAPAFYTYPVIDSRTPDADAICYCRMREEAENIAEILSDEQRYSDDSERGSSRLLGLVLAAVVAGLALACLVVFR